MTHLQDWFRIHDQIFQITVYRNTYNTHAKALKKYTPAIVIVAPGANDGLRGLSLNAIQENIAEMIEQSQVHQAQVLLIGMQLPPHYGPLYNQRFVAVFSELAQHYQTALMPFLLKGVGENKALFQEDGLHPKAQAQSIIMDNVWQYLTPLLQTHQSPKL